jgi:hypothetical protein
VRALAIIAVSVAFGACCVAARAQATPPPPVALDWQGPDECQEAPRVLSGVERLLGRDRGDSTLAARVSVKRAGQRWHLALTMQRAGRTTLRELDAESCTAAADAASVILALTIDPSSALGEDSVDVGPTPPATPDAAATDAGGRAAPPGSGEEAGPAPEPPVSRGSALDLPLVVIASGASDTGTLPRTSFGFGGGLGFLAKPIRIEATLAYWPTVSAPLGATPARGGSFAMIVTELRACALADASFLSLGGCGGWAFTSMQAEAFGVTTPISAGATWSSFVADALVLGHLSRVFSVRLSVGLAAPFSRPTFEIEGLGVVYQPAPAALELGAGVEAQF